MRHIRFWGEWCLGCLGLTLLSAIVLFVLGAGGRSTAPNVSEVGWMAAVTFPYMVLLAGCFMLFILLISSAQIYFPLLVSMSATRRAADLGFLGATVVLILGIAAMMAAIWIVSPIEFSETGIDLLPVCIGLLFMESGGIIIFLAIGQRWGTKGVILSILIALAILGAAIWFLLIRDGAWITVRVEDNSLLGTQHDVGGNETLKALLRDWQAVVLGSGAALYAAASALLMVLNRNYEVRR